MQVVSKIFSRMDADRSGLRALFVCSPSVCLVYVCVRVRMCVFCVRWCVSFRVMHTFGLHGSGGSTGGGDDEEEDEEW